MGKLAIISDLHADINKFTPADLHEIAGYIRELGATRLHIAGDISNRFAREGEEIIETLNQVLPTTFNFGNHDMLSVARIEDSLAPGFLNFTPLPLANDTVLLAFNGWYDYGYARDPEGRRPSDLLVSQYKKRYWIDQFIKRPESDPSISQQLEARLDRSLETLERQGQRVIIATHFVPQQDFIFYPKPENKRAITWRTLEGLLGSQAIGDTISKYNTVSDVVFGHIHARTGVKSINNIDWHCRPIGYRYEWAFTQNWLRERGLPPRFHFARQPKVQTAYLEDLHQNWEQILHDAVTLLDY
ncbi:phosphoesterase [Ligilactobacillus salitolerans]|uniref:Phosphoesterase n=1 Tax=Ligilactobacillus salitolerans TaxID=1808352 RepID=A0A401IQ44_9LACO|nr:metallophosphoesterase [Ligilactobacillus salitolerans]GBG93633.1 phosphoesterase [Ligilactobacillus salitolerans]